MTTEEAIYEAPSRKIFITRESGQVGQLSFQLKDTSAVSLTDYIAITLGGLVLGSMLLIGSFSLMLISSFSHWIFWSAVVLCLLSIFILALFGWKGREMASLSICTGSQLDAKSYRHPSRGFSYSDLAHIAAAIESAKTDKPVGQCLLGIPLHSATWWQRCKGTGKPVEIAFCVVVGFKGGKISHEHIYWDQAGVLVQVGLLDPAGLPVSGAESARKVLDPKLPARRM